MKNKKIISLAMAAATVAPMAVPTFAAEQTQGRILETDTATGNQTATIDVMLANGYELYTIGERHLLSRTEVFNTNGTEYTSDDSIKESLGKDAKVLVVKDNGDEHNLNDDYYVVVKKASQDKVIAQQERISLAQKEIEELKQAGYTISRTNEAARFEYDSTHNVTKYIPSKIVIRAKLGN